MKRTVGIALVAIVEVLFGLSLFLMAALMWFGALAINTPQMQQAGGRGTLLAIGAVYVLMGGVGVATGIALWMLKQWGRVLTIIGGAMLVCIGLLTAVVMLLIPLPTAPNLDPSVASAVKFVTVGFFGGVALIGVWWIVLLLRPKVRELFAQAAAGRGEALEGKTGRPLSITILAWYFLIFGPLGLAWQLFIHAPLPLFGYLVTGAMASAVHTLWVVAYVAISIGMLRLKPLALKAFIAVLLFGAVNGAMFSLMPGREERIARILQASPQFAGIQESQSTWVFSPGFQIPVFVVSLGIPFYFAITRKKRFEEAAAAQLSGSPGLRSLD